MTDGAAILDKRIAFDQRGQADRETEQEKIGSFPFAQESQSLLAADSGFDSDSDFPLYAHVRSGDRL